MESINTLNLVAFLLLHKYNQGNALCVTYEEVENFGNQLKHKAKLNGFQTKIDYNRTSFLNIKNYCSEYLVCDSNGYVSPTNVTTPQIVESLISHGISFKSVMFMVSESKTMNI